MDTPRKFKVWCEFEFDGILHKEMCGPENWFLLSQTGKLMSHGPTGFQPNAAKDYKVLIALFWTGLLDKHGKEIYEGDLVRVVLYPNSINEMISIRRVIWSDFHWGWALFDPTCGQYLHSKAFCPNAHYFEVIGNIYENPELVPCQNQPQPSP
jgi:hypothetical protein